MRLWSRWRQTLQQLIVASQQPDRKKMLSQYVHLARQVLGHRLNKGRRAGAIGRVLRWQIASRLMPAPIAFPFVEGTRLLAKKGDTGATGNWYSGLSDLDEMAFLLHFLRPDDLMVDVGANVGSYSVLAAGVVGAFAIAIEPVPRTFESLRACIGLNRLEDRVELLCCGLSEFAGTIRMSTDLGTQNSVAESSRPGALVLPTRTLDEVCLGRDPRLIKIDVEGYELPTIKGGVSVLEEPSLQAVIMETNGLASKMGSTDKQLVDAMTGHGFVACSYDGLTRTVTQGVIGGTNTIFLRDPAGAETACRSARRFRTINGDV